MRSVWPQLKQALRRCLPLPRNTAAFLGARLRYQAAPALQATLVALRAHLSSPSTRYSSARLTIVGRDRILKPMLNNRGARPGAVDAVFHALAEPTRRALVERLSAGPISVSDLARPFDMTLAAIVQHLQVLEHSGLVRTEKIGRVRTCRVDPAGLSLAENWLAERRTRWERKLDRLADILAEPDITRRKPAKKGQKP